MSYKRPHWFERGNDENRRTEALILHRRLQTRLKDEIDSAPTLTLAEVHPGQKIVDWRYYIFTVVKVSPKSVVIQADGLSGLPSQRRIFESTFQGQFRAWPNDRIVQRIAQLHRRREFILNFARGHIQGGRMTPEWTQNDVANLRVRLALYQWQLLTVKYTRDGGVDIAAVYNGDSLNKKSLQSLITEFERERAGNAVPSTKN